jgi:hypothetical protein
VCIAFLAWKFVGLVHAAIDTIYQNDEEFIIFIIFKFLFKKISPNILVVEKIQVKNKVKGKKCERLSVCKGEKV